MTWGMIGSAAVGAVGSGLLGGSGSSGNVGSKVEPWAPAQPYILDQLKNNQTLQDFYKQKPFNQQQQTSYQNTFNDLDQFRSQTVPGLMDFANGAMTNNYQRQRGGAPGSMAGYSAPAAQSAQPSQFDGLMAMLTSKAQEQAQPAPQAQQEPQPTGLLSSPQPAIQPSGLVSTGQPGPFSGSSQSQQLPPAMQPAAQPQTAPAGSYGQVNFAAQNPFANVPAPAAPVQATAQAMTLEEIRKMLGIQLVNPGSDHVTGPATYNSGGYVSGYDGA